MNVKVSEGKLLSPKLRYSAGSCLETLRKTAKTPVMITCTLRCRLPEQSALYHNVHCHGIDVLFAATVPCPRRSFVVVAASCVAARNLSPTLHHPQFKVHTNVTPNCRRKVATA